jgi:uncharacterized protein (DUF433 family)
MRNLAKSSTMQMLDKYVKVDKETASGVPVFRGTRVAVQTLFDYLEESSLHEFLEGFPSVSREQAEAVIAHAATIVISEIAA